MRRTVGWLLVVAIIIMLLPAMAGAATHLPGEVRRTIYLQSSGVRISTTSPLVLKCWLDPWDFWGCDTFCLNIVVRSVTGSNVVVVKCNDQTAYTFSMGAGGWYSAALGNWALFLHPGMNTIKVVDQTWGSVAEAGQIKLTLVPSTWHDGIPQYDNPMLPLRAFFGPIHVHTNAPGDDGTVGLSYYANLAPQRGWAFVIPTRHNPTAAQQWARAQECNQLSSSQCTFIPGAEIMTTWKPGAYLTSYSHALALYYSGSSFMEQLQGRTDYQPYVNRYANSISSVLIAAHPTLMTDKLFKFDFRSWLGTVMTKGVEYFGFVTAAQEEETFQKILDFARKRVLCIVTSSCDFHSTADPLGSERLLRLTEVFATDNSVASLMRAIIYGRTCATAKKTRLEWTNYIPGARAYNCYGTPNLIFDVKFGGTKYVTVTYELYRDGTLIATKSKLISGTDVKVRFETQDTGATVGQHWYNMRVKGYLVPSQIIINRY